MTDGLSEAYEGKIWDVFCENNELLLENDELKAENAKLRTQLADVTESMGRVEERCAKLRELVRDMCVWAYIDSDCDLEDRFAYRMRELGVEVDG